MLTYVVKLSKDGLNATFKPQKTNLYVFKSVSVDEANYLANLPISFARKKASLISPSFITLTGINANFADQIKYNPYPGNGVSLAVQQLYADDQAKTLSIVYSLHKGITIVRRGWAIVTDFPEVAQNYKAVLNE